MTLHARRPLATGRTGFLLLAIALASSAHAQTARGSDWEALDAHVDSSLDRWAVPGVAVGVVLGGELVWAHASGVRSLNEATPVDRNTVFAIGSATKTFTAAAIQLLADEGRIDVDRAAVEYMPELRLATDDLTEAVTARDLLSHRTGLPPDNLMYWGADVGRDELVRRVRFLSPTAPLRRSFQYQNVLYLVAGQLVPAVSRKTWDELVQERLFAPLGMSSSTTSVPAGDVDNVADAHASLDGEWHVIDLLDVSNCGPAGAIHSNVVDMASWMKMLLEGGVYDGRRVLTERAVTDMQAAAIGIPGSGQYGMLFPLSQGASYGLGWFLHEYRGRRILEHGGSTDGMHSLVFLVPEEGLGVVVLTNALAFGLPHSIAYRVLDTLTGEAPEPASDAFWRLWTAFQPQIRLRRFQAPDPPPSPPGDLVERVLGRYSDPRYGNAEVRREGDLFTLHVLGRAGRAYPSGDSGFSVDWGEDLFLHLSAPTFRFAPDPRDAREDAIVLAGVRWTRDDAD
jgi:CubicO group peptidase (beta-lactamase class C family)